MKAGKQIHSLRGFRDIVPQEQKYWQYVYRTFDAIARAYSFQKIDLPLLEETSLFKRAVGDDTDIVEKEMFDFIDKGEDSVTLRPEGTAGAVRAYIEHGMLNQPQPVKLYYEGPMFRYERPQAGRFRQFYQVGIESFGAGAPVVDAEIILVAYSLCKSLGLSTTVQVNSLGSPESRELYKKALLEYYKPKKNMLCESCKKRLVKNPMRILDCKEKGCQEYKEDAPQLVDHLIEEDKTHFVKVLEHLDEAEVPYVLNPFVVRGFDYYTRTIFEIWPQTDSEKVAEGIDGEGKEKVEEKEKQDPAQSALGGGGRYDLLVEYLGGNPTPASGMAMGVDRLVALMKQQKVDVPDNDVCEVFLAQLGEEAKKRSLKLFEMLRQGGVRVKSNFSKDGLKQQLEMANKYAVQYTMILGQKEIMDGTLLIRDMESGIQEVVDFNKAVSEIRKRLEKSQNIVIAGAQEVAALVDASGESESAAGSARAEAVSPETPVKRGRKRSSRAEDTLDLEDEAMQDDADERGVKAPFDMDDDSAQDSDFTTFGEGEDTEKEQDDETVPYE